jgi:flagellar motility protein MotE (MotC chaperone)
VSEEPERELDDMEERARRLEAETEKAREDWERRKQDPSVPGATPDDGDDEDEDEG